MDGWMDGNCGSSIAQGCQTTHQMSLIDTALEEYTLPPMHTHTSKLFLSLVFN